MRKHSRSWASCSSTATITPRVSSYRNFQLFIEKIDNAIAGQEDVVRSSQQRVAEARAAWQACERKRMSYDTLATRARDKEMQKQNKRDQKSMDEHASRITFYKR